MSYIYKEVVLKQAITTLNYTWAVLLFLSSSLFAQDPPPTFNPTAEIEDGVYAPNRIASDANGVTYVTDAYTKTVSKFDASGTFLGSIDAVNDPVSVAVNSEGKLFIGDGNTGHIYSYDENLGATEFYVGAIYPNAMEFRPDNVLYVSDSRLQLVLAIDLSGNLIQTIGSGYLDFPTGIAIDNKNKRVLVGEHGGSGTGFSPTVRVYKFDFQGNYLGYFGRHGNSAGRFYRIQGIEIGKCGDIYVVDPYLARISVFNENGVYKTKFGEWGTLPNQLNIPMDILYDAQGTMQVTSMNNGNLELYSVTLPTPCSNFLTEHVMMCAGETADLEIAFEGTAPWTFTYTVDDVNPQTVTTSDNPYYLSVSEAGHYKITALSDAVAQGNCITGSAEVVIASGPPTAFLSGDADNCFGESVDLTVAFTGSSPWTFTYAHDGSDAMTVSTTNNPHFISVSDPGTYVLTELSGGGCTGTVMTGSASIVELPLPTATITNGDGQISISPGETADLTVALGGTPPWEITFTVDDTNPITISNISESPYIIEASEFGIYKIEEVTDTYCSNTVTEGFPEVVLLLLPPVAADDYAETPNISPVVIDVLSNDYDPDGILDFSTVNIIEYPQWGSLDVSPGGTIYYDPVDTYCGQDVFTYTVADDMGSPSEPASVFITVTDGNPPIFTDVPADITVSCTTIPEPPIVSATDACDPFVTVTYLGDIADNSCGTNSYTITRSWEATDGTGNSAYYSQLITVETQFTAGCFTIYLASAEYIMEEDKTTFTWALTANACVKGLAYIVFHLPDYTVAVDPLDQSIFSNEGNDFDYEVTNPYGSVNKGNWGISFSAEGLGLSEGGPEMFTYSLPGEVMMEELVVEIKSGKDVFYANIPTSACACGYGLSEKSSEIAGDIADNQSMKVRTYPNPFSQQLFFEFQSPVDTYGMLEIFDITGSKLMTLFDGNLMAGQKYNIEYNPEALPKGLIFYKMITKEKVVSGKVIYTGE